MPKLQGEIEGTASGVMEGRIVPSIRRVKEQMCGGGLEAHPGPYALMFTVLPISPYTQITISKNNTYFQVTVAVAASGQSPANNLSQGEIEGTASGVMDDRFVPSIRRVNTC